MKRILKKIIRASPDEKSRLHDLHGVRISFWSLSRNGPRAALSTILTRGLKVGFQRPWISYDASAVIARKLKNQSCTVLEFGSGNSTLWFMQRAVEIHSVEHDPEWYSRVHTKIEAAQPKCRVEHELRSERKAYATFRAHSGKKFSIILIDGMWREDCLRQHADLLAEDGLLYLDNTDADTSCGESGELHRCVQYLYQFASRRGLRTRTFTDFSPCALHATQGIMLTAG